QRRRLSGEAAFRLYDTFGLPIDYIQELAQDAGVDIDLPGFEQALEAQRERSRQSSKMDAVTGDPLYLGLLEKGKTRFVGYESLTLDDARVLAVLKDGQLARRLDAGQDGQVILDRTPFYGASGGQVGDHGWMSAEGSTAEGT